jgi:murein L,D-transpeptidase YafK
VAKRTIIATSIMGRHAWNARTIFSFLLVFLVFPSLTLTAVIEAPDSPSSTARMSPETCRPSTGLAFPSPPSSSAIAPLTPGTEPLKMETYLKADRVVIKKSERLLYLMKGDQILKTYRIALGRNPTGHKVRLGDYRTPEGEYVIDWRNHNSKFYLSLHISYPNQRDVEKARRLGVTPGGAIMIHGLPNGLGWIKDMHTIADWTKGCIAVTNEEMDELWRYVPDGTPVRIDG